MGGRQSSKLQQLISKLVMGSRAIWNTHNTLVCLPFRSWHVPPPPKTSFPHCLDFSPSLSVEFCRSKQTASASPLQEEMLPQAILEFEVCWGVFLRCHSSVLQPERKDSSAILLSLTLIYLFLVSLQLANSKQSLLAMLYGQFYLPVPTVTVFRHQAVKGGGHFLGYMYLRD